MAEVVNLYERNFQVTEQSGVVTVAARPNLELDFHTQPEFSQALIEAAGSAACSALVVDLSQATFMDASGLNVLINTRRVMEERHQPLVVDLAGPQTHEIKELLNITGVMEELFVIDAEQPAEPPQGTKSGPFTVYSNPNPTATPPGMRGGTTRRPQLRVLPGGAEATA